MKPYCSGLYTTFNVFDPEMFLHTQRLMTTFGQFEEGNCIFRLQNKRNIIEALKIKQKWSYKYVTCQMPTQLPGIKALETAKPNILSSCSHSSSFFSIFVSSLVKFPCYFAYFYFLLEFLPLILFCPLISMIFLCPSAKTCSATHLAHNTAIGASSVLQVVLMFSDPADTLIPEKHNVSDAVVLSEIDLPVMHHNHEPDCSECPTLM